MEESLFEIGAFLAANRGWASSFAWGGLDVRPKGRMAVLTCMDSRFTAQGILGLELGDAHVIRNAGGRVTDDAVRSLVLSAHALGTRGCVLIHHTKCGLYGNTNEAIHQLVSEATGGDASGIDFLPFADLEESVREDMRQLAACDLLPEGYSVLGFTYDVDTGLLTQIRLED
ncbi:MAG: beta-class carbonic anhydrase [Dehalococcoidia bacterium]